MTKMAAPTTVPSHHIKGDVAPNRPAYREGRFPKATKVYTVNQESVYLIVQGVPALGTSQELIKLFAVYGAVEEYRILDEYPTADKYTDVYLIKFQKIQAARFSKRKLDDYSFYGGVLHISYAPEFESVDETRQKLQERRRTLASRIRILGSESQKKSTGRDRPSAELDHHDITNIQDTNAGVSENTQLPFNQDSSSQVPQTHSQTDSDYQVTQPEQCYYIPPPPRQDYGSKFHHVVQSKRTYEYARVPSAHATLPRENEEDQRVPIGQEYNTNNSKQTMRNAQEYDSNDTKHQTMRKESKADTQQNVPSESKTREDIDKQSHVKTVDGLIVKNIPQQRSTPKFIPRQTLNIVKTQLKPCTEDNINKDPLRSELQRNAFLLGKKHGPEAREEGKSSVGAEDQSVSNTVSQIRKRVQKVFEPSIYDKKEKQRKPNETNEQNTLH